MSGAVLAERFLMREQLGDGTFATVWRATDRSNGREVALKVLRQDLAAAKQAAARFELEARVLSGLSHPAIARALDFVLAPDAAAIVLELVEGRTLLEEMISRARVQQHYTGRELLSILERVADGLHHAHLRGIIHRDLKPSNVMMSGAGLKILDFGVAKVLGAERHEATTQGRMLGTYAYMSPEQINGLEVDHRSDIFALACICFELLTLRWTWVRERQGEASIFDTESIAADGPNNYVNFLARICRGDRPRVSDYRREVPPEVDRVIAAGLAIAPDERPSTVHALVEALRAALAPSGNLPDVTDGVPVPTTAPEIEGLRVDEGSIPPVDTLLDARPLAIGDDKTVAVSVTPSPGPALPPAPERPRTSASSNKPAAPSSSKPPLVAPSISKPPLAADLPTPVTPALSFRLVRAVQPQFPGILSEQLPRPPEPPSPTPERRLRPETPAMLAWIVAAFSAVALAISWFAPEVIGAAAALVGLMVLVGMARLWRARQAFQRGRRRTEALIALVKKDPRLFWQASAQLGEEHVLEGSPVDATCPGMALRLPLSPLEAQAYRVGVRFRHPGGALVPIEIDVERSVAAMRQGKSMFENPLAVAFVELLARRAPSPIRLSGGLAELSFGLVRGRPEEAQEELWFCLVGASLLAQWLRTKIDDAPH
ncbi:MAG: protein kinase [Myxococcota bacterium]